MKGSNHVVRVTLSVGPSLHYSIGWMDSDGQASPTPLLCPLSCPPPPEHSTGGRKKIVVATKSVRGRGDRKHWWGEGTMRQQRVGGEDKKVGEVSHGSWMAGPFITVAPLLLPGSVTHRLESATSGRGGWCFLSFLYWNRRAKNGREGGASCLWWQQTFLDESGRERVRLKQWLIFPSCTEVKGRKESTHPLSQQAPLPSPTPL